MAHISFDGSKLSKFVHDNELGEMQALVNAADDELRKGTGAGSDFRDWLTLPKDYDKEEFARIQAAAKQIQSDSKVLVVIGIGGSYLGAKMAVDFLNDTFFNYLPDDRRKFPQVMFAGNSLSSSYVYDLINLIGDRDFSVNVISKSGTTTEPSIAFRIFKERLIENMVQKVPKSGSTPQLTRLTVLCAKKLMPAATNHSSSQTVLVADTPS